MHNWFSTYHADDWTPEKGYNEVFREVVRIIRGHFKLKRVEFGQDAGTGVWIPYHLQGRDFWVNVKSFEWGEVIRYNGYISPHLRLNTEIYTSRKKKIFEGPLVIEFPQSFPQQPPRLRIDLPNYINADGAEHHIYGQDSRGYTWCCLMRYAGEWTSKDTVITAVNMALDLIVWHIDTWGW